LKKEPLKKGHPNKDHFKQKQQQKKLFEEKKLFAWVGLAVIILLGIIIYSNSLKCSFQFDDTIHIVYNPAIKNLQDVKIWWNYSDRPVSIFTFALNYHFHQLDVYYYHIVNLLIHLINAVLIWWLTLLIFSSPALRDQPISKHKKVLAFFTALLFVSHPLATQSVTYIIQRQNSMAAMFYILSLALYLKGRLPETANKHKYILFAGSLIAAFLAVLSKENAFTLPLAIVLVEIFFLQTKRLSISFRDYRIILLIAVFLIFIVILFFKFPLSIFDPIPPTQGNTYTVTSLNYLFTQFSVIVKYIQLLILPVNQTLDYDFPISDNFFELKTLFSFLLLFALIILAVFLFNKHRIFSFGIFWFFLTLSIESGFIPISDVIYEHRTYLPSFGFFLILSSGIYALRWNKYKYLAISILLFIIGTNSFLTHERNKVWKNELTLWSDAVLKSPGKARPVNNRGFIYLNLGQWEKAIADFSKAIEIYPKWAVTYYNRGVAYEKLGEQQKSIVDYSAAIGIDPKYSEAYYNRGIVYGNMGQMELAMADFSKAVEIQPDYKNAFYNRGVCYLSQGQWDKSIDDFTKVIEMDPNHAKSYSNRGAAWANLGEWDKAIADYSKALEMEPNLATTFNNRGNAYMNTGQFEKAMADYFAAIEIDSNFAEAKNNRDKAFQKLNSGKTSLK